MGQRGNGHRVVQHAASLRDPEHARRDPRHRSIEDSRRGPGDWRRVRRQASRGRGACRGTPREEGGASGQGPHDGGGGTDRRLSTSGNDRRAQDGRHAGRSNHGETRANLVRHRRLCRVRSRSGVGRHARARGAVSHSQPRPRRPCGLHEQDELRIVPCAVGPAVELRRRVADGHHRGRARPRSAGLPPEEHRARGRRGAHGPGAERCRARGVSGEGGGRDRVERSAPGPVAGQGPRVRVVDHDGRLVRRLREDQHGRHDRVEHGRRRDRHGRTHRRGTGARRGAERGPGGHQRRLRGHVLDTVRLRRAGKSDRLRGRQCLSRGGGRFDPPAVRARRPAPGR